MARQQQDRGLCASSRWGSAHRGEIEARPPQTATNHRPASCSPSSSWWNILATGAPRIDICRGGVSHLSSNSSAGPLFAPVCAHRRAEVVSAPKKQRRCACSGRRRPLHEDERTLGRIEGLATSSATAVIRPLDKYRFAVPQSRVCSTTTMMGSKTPVGGSSLSEEDGPLFPLCARSPAGARPRP